MKSQPESNGSKIATTAIIWAFATGMLAISIPLVAMTKSGVILPLTVVLGAGGGTVGVWRPSNRQPKKIAELTESIHTLEQRIVDLEAICSSQDILIEQKFKQLESTQNKQQT